MVLERYRVDAGKAFTPFALLLGRVGFTPNTISVTSLAFALVAGVAFYLASAESPRLLVVAALFVTLNALFDAFDGVLARAQNASSKRGDYLDHVIDRYADVAILTGIALSSLVDVRIGLLAIVGTFLTSYMGTQAQALGLGRNYTGLLGRADRLVLLIGIPVVEYVLVTEGIAVPIAGSALNALLAYFAIVGNLTAIQRFFAGWRELSNQGS